MTKYTLTQLKAEFKRIIEGMPTCVIVQAGDSNERIEEVTGTTEQPRDTNASALNAWRRLFAKSGIVYTSSRSVYLAVVYKNGFALHAIGDDNAPRTEIKGVVKYDGKIVSVAQPDTDEITFESVEQVKCLMDRLELLSPIAV